MVRRATLLIALAALAAPAVSAAAPPPPGADLSITKRADLQRAQPGDLVLIQLTVRNTGNQTAETVRAIDVLPPGLEFADSEPACSHSAGTVTCSYEPLPPGGVATRGFRVRVVGAPYPTADQHRHDLRIGKVEASVTLAPGEERTEIIGCAPDQIATDGTSEVLAVDQGTGTLDSVKVLEQYAFDGRRYRYVLRNTATGQAQVKLFVVCVDRSTQPANPGPHAHELQTQWLAGGDITGYGPGRYTFETPSCAGGTPIAPGYRLLGNVATPAGDGALVGVERIGDRFRLTIEVQAGFVSAIETHTGCLDDSTTVVDDHRHRVSFSTVERTVGVPAGGSVTESVTCPDGSKGAVATYRLAPQLGNGGNDPQPKTRVFHVRNPGPGAADAQLGVLCLAERTGDAIRVITNTATVTSSTPDIFDPPSPSSVLIEVHPVGTPRARTAAPLPVRDGAVAVTLSCPSGAGCDGTVAIVGRTAQGARVILGQRGYRLGARATAKTRVTLRKAYRRAAARRGVRSLALELRETTDTGTIVSRQRLRLR